MEESIVSKGITEDYLWQEAKAISNKIAELHGMLQEFATAVANRDKDNRDVIAKLYAENFQMQEEIKDMKKGIVYESIT